MSLISPALRQRLSALSLRSRRRAAGVQMGERKSIRRGQSQEFADHRPYVAGDDLRFLDWHLYARFDSLWVKLFEEEEDRTVQILLDSSASMEGAKLDYAQRVAAALSFIALGHNDRVTVAGLGDRITSYAPPQRGRSAATPVFRALESIRASGPTDLVRAVQAYPRHRGAGIGLLFTDFLWQEGPESALRRLLGRGLDLHVFHVLSPAEVQPSLEGDLMLVDKETGDQVPVTVDEAALDRYREAVSAWRAGVEQTCRRLGVGYSALFTEVSIDDLVLRDLRRQGVVS